MPQAGEAGAAPALAAEAFAGGPADYFALLKPRVMSLVCFTGLAGMLLAPGALHPVVAVAALLCIAVGAGAAGAINMWCDRDIDALMERTRDRPIPAGRVAPDAALGFGATLAVGAVATMALATNWLAAALLALAIGFYVFVYTLFLKRRTPSNIVIGGAAGALPPVIGWAAVSGEAGLVPWTLFAIVFVWTPPHFWALSLYRAHEYARAGVPMLPAVAGRRETRRRILLYSVALAPLALAPAALGVAGWLYALGVALLGAGFVHRAAVLWRSDDDADARRLFGYSIVWLFLVFVLLVADGLLFARGG